MRTQPLGDIHWETGPGSLLPGQITEQGWLPRPTAVGEGTDSLPILKAPKPGEGSSGHFHQAQGGHRLDTLTQA